MQTAWTKLITESNHNLGCQPRTMGNFSGRSRGSHTLGKGVKKATEDTQRRSIFVCDEMTVYWHTKFCQAFKRLTCKRRKINIFFLEHHNKKSNSNRSMELNGANIITPSINHKPSSTDAIFCEQHQPPRNRKSTINNLFLFLATLSYLVLE